MYALKRMREDHIYGYEKNVNEKKIAMLKGLRMRRRGENRVLTLKLPLIGDKFHFPIQLRDNSFGTNFLERSEKYLLTGVDFDMGR